MVFQQNCTNTYDETSPGKIKRICRKRFFCKTKLSCFSLISTVMKIDFFRKTEEVYRQ